MQIAVRLPDEIAARLDALAKATGRPRAFYIRQAILEYLDDLEDLYLAEQRLSELRAGRDEAIGGDEFWHGLAD